MITLLYDPDSKYEIGGDYIRINYTELPKSYNTSTEIHNILLSKPIDGSVQQVAIEGVDMLDEKKSALLTRILLSVSPSTKILLTARNEHKVSRHLLNLSPLIKRLRGSPVRKELSLWQKLKIYVRSRAIPENSDLLMLFRSVGDTLDINQSNRELACDLDRMLFKTDSRYLAVAWAGLHNKQSVGMKIVSTKKEEPKIKKKPKIHPTKMKRAKKAVRKGLEEWL